MKTDFSLLKKLFSIHSKSGHEGKIRKYICNWVKQNIPEAEISVDRPGNLYITKGKSETYPCIAAHMDQVQDKHSKDFQCYEGKDVIFGFSSRNKRFEGLGSDDSVGLWIGLICLQEFDCIKLAFFVEEETGCVGSSKADMDFFNDVRFVIEPDRKGSDDLITVIGWTSLCSEEFLKSIGYKKYGYKEADGLLTDIAALKENGLPVSCINVSCGYYKPHTDQEFVFKPAVINCLKFVRHIVKTCKKVYPHVDETYQYDSYNYYGDDYYSEIYDLLSNNPNLSFGDVEEIYKSWYGKGKYNREALETSYDQALDDIRFWKSHENEDNTRLLTN